MILPGGLVFERRIKPQKLRKKGKLYSTKKKERYGWEKLKKD